MMCAELQFHTIGCRSPTPRNPVVHPVDVLPHDRAILRLFGVVRFIDEFEDRNDGIVLEAYTGVPVLMLGAIA